GGPHPPVRQWHGRPATGLLPVETDADHGWWLTTWVVTRAVPAGLTAKRAALLTPGDEPDDEPDDEVPTDGEIARWRTIPPVRTAADLPALEEAMVRRRLSPEDRMLRRIFGGHPSDETVADAYGRTGLDAVARTVRRCALDVDVRDLVDDLARWAAESVAHLREVDASAYEAAVADLNDDLAAFLREGT
ncbi:hypothetical protein, partial [Virgisporangium ochraceum]|uniref:hypothetical protein n=1 Tax=Virgisporangium ochraceum TaxID=65505 RepID=UPI001942FA73